MEQQERALNEDLDEDTAKATVSETESEEDVMRKPYYFGCGPCHPKWMQYLFARKVFFTLILSTFSFLQTGLVSGNKECFYSVVTQRMVVN